MNNNSDINISGACHQRLFYFLNLSFVSTFYANTIGIVEDHIKLAQNLKHFFTVKTIYDIVEKLESRNT